MTRAVITEAAYEKLADAMVMRRLGTDKRYLWAENAEEQANAETQIEREVCQELDQRYRIHDRPCECEGHPAGPFDPMGQTVYCDGSCRR